jgi:hypothetical protein
MAAFQALMTGGIWALADTVETMILKMKTEKRKVAHIARELNLSRQTVYEVLKRA